MAVLKVKFSKTRRGKLAQVLWILNWISVVTGLIIFSLGLYLKIEIKKRSEFMLSGNIQSVPNMLIAVGTIACIINFFGGKICYDWSDANKFSRWKLFILPYIICTFFFTFCVFAGAIMCYTMRNEVESALYRGLKDALRYYKDTDIPGRCFLKTSIDLLQIEFQCCGNNGFRDWFEIQWISVRYLDMSSKDTVDRFKSNVDGKYLLDGVPFSCCNPNSPRPCIQYQITNNSAHYNYDYLSEELNIWIRGCRQALLEYYDNLMHSIGLTVLLVWLFELSVLTGVRYLQTATQNVLIMGDPESESDGWLLENSCMETAKHNFTIIKNLGKINQISTVSGKSDPNMDIPTADYGPDNVPPSSIPTDS